MKVYLKGLLTGLMITAACCTGSTGAHAQRQPVITAPPLAGDSIKTGKAIVVQDTVYFDPVLRTKIAATRSLDNMVSLSVNELEVIPDSFDVNLRLQLDYVNKTGNVGSLTDSLQLSHRKNIPYDNKAVKFYSDYYSLRVTVLGMTITGAPDSTVRRALTLENMIVLDRFFIASCNAISTVSSDASQVASQGELIASWPAIAFVPAYDLEWTFIDQSALDAGNYNTNGTLDPSLIFQNNATRVTLSGNSYHIPLLYDGDGVLYFRVRPVQNTPQGEVMAGAWSTGAGAAGLGSYTFTGHERKLNWQATTSYAEEGKRKSVVQYYDGSLKARQTVTKDNSTNTTIVAETLYDKQGRPVIQVLPAPTLSSLIAYTPLFNVQGVNSAEYDKSVYDTLITANEYCARAADSMSSYKGAAGYYSPLNPLVATSTPDELHQFVPDAKGYPFTETRYTRDNTGRIDRQGGVGPDFRIGTDHETKYYYGAPTQAELDALFGTEAGDASHYEKNMVRDANGQYSVSYVDMHGRTVATALAGQSPQSLQALPSYTSLTQTDNLLTPSNNIIRDNAIRASGSILVPVKGDYAFHYSLSPESLSLDDCSNTPVCYDCLYDLTITISDNCDNQQFGGHPKVVTIKNFSLFKEDGVTHAIDTSCAQAAPLTTDFTLTLEEGSYDITKNLSVSRPAMEYYRDSIYLPHNTCKSYNQLVLEMLDSLRSRLDCTPDKAVTNLPQAWREQMLADLTPLGGQYTRLGDNAFSSIFRKAGNRYRFQTVAGYKDADGNPATAMHYNAGTGEYVQVRPDQLTAQEFIDNFQESWAETLLPLHPEYRLLQEYEKLKSAYAWETEFFNTQTYAEAVAKGFLNPTGSATLPASRFAVSGHIDSLFIALEASDPASVSTAKAAIDNLLFRYVKKDGVIPATYYNLWGVATSTVQCNNIDPNCHDYWNTNANIFNTSAMCAADLDQAWKLFRSVYLSVREDWIDTYTRNKAAVPAGTIPDSLVAVFPVHTINAYGSSASPEVYGNYHGDATDTATAATNLDAYLLANCKAYAERWWQQLAPCGYTPADSAAIIDTLIRVAYEGADAQHPFGSSTVKPASAYHYRSFDQVIAEYNAAHYPAMDPVRCNAYLITNPRPYDKPAMIVNKPIIQAPDSCTCDRINSLYSQFLANAAVYHDFANYLHLTQGTIISNGKLDTLRNLCSVSSDCKYLEQPIMIPPALQCQAGNSCADCSVVQSWYDSFTVRFQAAPSYDDNTEATQLVNRLFESYMNAHLGFANVYTDYLDFLQNCPVGKSSLSSCDSLKQLEADYRKSQQGIVPDASFYNLCQVNFTAYFNQHYGTAYTFSQIDSIYQSHCGLGVNVCSADPCNTSAWVVYNPGDALPVSNTLAHTAYNNIASITPVFSGGHFNAPSGANIQHYVVVNKRDSVDAGNMPLLLQWRVKPAPFREWGANPFVTRGNNNTYFGAQWSRDISDTSWWIGTTLLSGNDGAMIKGIGLQSADTSLQADWVRITNLAGDSIVYREEFSFTSSCDSTPVAGPLLCGNMAMDSTVAMNFSPCADTSVLAAEAAQYLFDIYREKLKGEFEKAYTGRCLSAGHLESFTVVHPQTEYHYTLYYYDQAGNLIKTVPPEGVDLHRELSWYANVAAARTAGASLVNSHRMATTYRYNSLNQVISQHSPDGGLSRFWYDRLGRLVVSQNAKQVAENRYSYTLYDQLGRITEVGQKYQAMQMTDGLARDAFALNSWLGYTYVFDAGTVIAEQVTKTVYDERDPETAVLPTDNYVVNPSFQKAYTLRNRVSYTRYYDKLGYAAVPLVSDYDNSTTYSYDVHGNVDTLLHHYRTGLIAGHGNNQFKAMAYKYDLVSGKVNEVHYQPGMKDQFYHRYVYDAENRLTDVYTAERKAALGVPGKEEHDARYSYYRHGPLGRTVVGDLQVQGIDNAYTLQGWMKGVNSDSLIDKDGMPGSIVPRDAYRFSLNYYNGDYSAIGDAVRSSVFAGHSAYLPAGEYRPLYNGNISSMVVGIPQLGETRLYNYGYDQLNRIVGMDAYTGYNPATHSWGVLDNHNGEYRERVSYDANGNILTYNRNGTGVQPDMDKLQYGYNRDGSGNLVNNRLRHVKDVVADSNYPDDLDNQPDDNYEYDAIGNLIKDRKEGLVNVEWNVYGKIKSISKDTNGDGTVDEIITYTYDVAGNRISKTVGNETTYYIRDGSGNVMSIYTVSQCIACAGGGGNEPLKQKEVHLYGSSRLGILKRDVDMDSPADLRNYTSQRGNKRYEGTNHLGNTLVVFTDRRLNIDRNGDGVVDNYEVEIANANDYYPFGMQMPGRVHRSLGEGGYRYGFNGKENDNEVKGEGNQQDYGMRISDPRVGRFLSVDPLTKSYPWYTPYQFAGNKVIEAIDLDGAEEYYINQQSRLKFDIQFRFKVDARLKEYQAYQSQWVQLRDIYGELHSGQRLIVERDVAAIKQNHDDAIGENIRGGLGGAVGYLVAGDKGSYYGAVVDNVGYSFGGVTEKSSVLSKPEAIEPQKFTPTSGELNSKAPVVITIDANRHPEAALHAQEAMEKGVSGSGVIDRKGADGRRAIALKGIKTEAGKDRDEFPPAVINNGGKGSSVKLIPSSDNRGAGSLIGRQIRDIPDNTRVTIKVIPKK